MPSSRKPPKKQPAKKSRSQRAVWTEANKQRFIDWIDAWRGRLFLNGHHINVTFSESPMPDTDREKGVDDNASASASVNLPYMSGHTITFYPHMLKEPDLAEQERKVVHELLHIVTQPSKMLLHRMWQDKFVTWREAHDTNEMMTDWMASIAWSLYDSVKEQPK